MQKLTAVVMDCMEGDMGLHPFVQTKPQESSLMDKQLKVLCQVQEQGGTCIKGVKNWSKIKQILKIM